MPRTVEIASSENSRYWSTAEVLNEGGKLMLRVEATDGQKLWAGKLPFAKLESSVPKQLFDSTDVLIEHVFRLVYGIEAGLVAGDLLVGVECAMDVTVCKSRDAMRVCIFNFAVARDQGAKLQFKPISILLKEKDGADMSVTIGKLVVQRTETEAQLRDANEQVESIRALYQKTCRQLEESIALAERNERALLSKFARVLNEKKRAYTELTTEYEASQQVHMESLAAAEPSPIKRPRGRPPGKGKGKARAKGKGRALAAAQLRESQQPAAPQTAPPAPAPSQVTFVRGTTVSETPALVADASPQNTAAPVECDDTAAVARRVSDASTISRADSLDDGNASLVRRDTELSRNGGGEKREASARDNLMSLMDNMSDDEGVLLASDSDDDAVVARQPPPGASGGGTKRAREDSDVSTAPGAKAAPAKAAPGTPTAGSSSRALDDLVL